MRSPICHSVESISCTPGDCFPGCIAAPASSHADCAGCCCLLIGMTVGRTAMFSREMAMAKAASGLNGLTSSRLVFPRPLVGIKPGGSAANRFPNKSRPPYPPSQPALHVGGINRKRCAPLSNYSRTGTHHGTRASHANAHIT